jgi:hypothetical protein
MNNECPGGHECTGVYCSSVLSTEGECIAKDHDEFVNSILEQAPDSWDGDEPAERIAVWYVREMERRVMASGGTLERYSD